MPEKNSPVSGGKHGAKNLLEREFSNLGNHYSRSVINVN